MKEDVFHFGKGAFPAMSDYWRGFPFLFWREDWYIPFWSFRSSKRGLSKELYHWRPQSSNFALLWSLHFTPQVFDYSRCSVAEVHYIILLINISGPLHWNYTAKNYQQNQTSETSNFQWFRCWFMSFWVPFFRAYFWGGSLAVRFFGTGFFHRFPVEWPVSRIVLVWLQQLLDWKSWKERWNQAFGFR